MPAGFIYVLENETMPGLLKIGITEKEPDERAKELATTGVPSSFRVAYSRYVVNIKLVEDLVHKALESRGCRKNNNREFFAVSVAEAIGVIDAISSEQSGAASDGLSGYFLGESIYLQTKLPGYEEPIDEKEAERFRAKLIEIVRIGYHPALQTIAEIYKRNFRNSSLFRQYFQEYLIACLDDLKNGHDLRNNAKYEIGKSVGEYVECLIDMKRLMDADFDFVQKFLISGDQFIYGSFVDYVNRFFHGDIKTRCLNL